MPATKNITVFPKGMNTFIFAALPGVAGAHTCTGVVLATDTLLQVLAITHTNAIPSAVADITSECSITANAVVTNTTTDLSDMILLVLVARNLST